MGQIIKQEQGRSMVEMLGVLAVIGVLSVAGIAGYSMAMRNYRANEVLNAASMLYVMAMAKNQGTGADTNYSELGTPPSGTSLAYTVSDKKITITFPNEEDCTVAKNKLGDKATGNCAEKTLTVTLGEVATEPIPACEPGEAWNGNECVNSGYLYTVVNNSYTTHDNAHSCPEGYHWASSDEYLRDFPCEWDSLNDKYNCNTTSYWQIFTEELEGWLSDCVDETTRESVPCSSASHALVVTDGGDVFIVQRNDKRATLCRQ